MVIGPITASRIQSSRLVLPALALVALLGLASLWGPWLLWNQTDSEPLGLYERTLLSPAPGRIIAFRAPPTAFPYASERMDYLHRVSILKQVVAGEGDEVCTAHAVLTVNGRILAPVLKRDPRGRPLPQWRGCRRLTAGEYFVFSDRIPNSFDSRYYGPVGGEHVLGVFRPLWLAPAASGGL